MTPSIEDGAEDGAGWPVHVKAAAALLVLVLYLYCVVFMCRVYQRSQQLHHIDAMVSCCSRDTCILLFH